MLSEYSELKALLYAIQEQVKCPALFVHTRLDMHTVDLTASLSHYFTCFLHIQALLEAVARAHALLRLSVII